MRVKVLWQQHEHGAIESKIDMESGFVQFGYAIKFFYFSIQKLIIVNRPGKSLKWRQP